MTRYWAEVVDGVVQRVVLCDTRQGLEQRFGGTWVETRDPYAETQADHELEPVAYCGPGFGCDTQFPERFAPPWAQPIATEDGWTSYPRGALVWHDGRMWKSTVDGNVWTPGVSAWHDEPTIEGVRPQWVAPTGSHDVYPLGFIVQHNGKEWESLHAANVWEPGTDSALWRDTSAPSDEAPPWVQPTGAHDAYAAGARAITRGWVTQEEANAIKLT